MTTIACDGHFHRTENINTDSSDIASLHWAYWEMTRTNWLLPTLADNQMEVKLDKTRANIDGIGFRFERIFIPAEAMETFYPGVENPANFVVSQFLFDGLSR